MVDARERTLPLHAALTGLVPGGALQRGSTVGCSGWAATSLAMTIAAGPVGSGSWAAVAGLATFGVRAAVELGLDASRVVHVTQPPGAADPERWADAVAAMIDGFEVVVLGQGQGKGGRIRPQVARRLQARVQSRGAVLVTVGAHEGFSCDVQLVGHRQSWDGLGAGHGVATARRLELEVCGRRVPRERRALLWLPDADGAVRTEERAEVRTPLRLAQTG